MHPTHVHAHEHDMCMYMHMYNMDMCMCACTHCCRPALHHLPWGGPGTSACTSVAGKYPLLLSACIKEMSDSEARDALVAALSIVEAQAVEVNAASHEADHAAKVVVELGASSAELSALLSPTRLPPALLPPPRSSCRWRRAARLPGFGKTVGYYKGCPIGTAKRAFKKGGCCGRGVS